MRAAGTSEIMGSTFYAVCALFGFEQTCYTARKLIPVRLNTGGGRYLCQPWFDRSQNGSRERGGQAPRRREACSRRHLAQASLGGDCAARAGGQTSRTQGVALDHHRRICLWLLLRFNDSAGWVESEFLI